jgi:hypothetical protein
MWHSVWGMLTWVADPAGPVAHYYEYSTKSPGYVKAVGLVVCFSGS